MTFAVDSSALIAILRGEPEADDFAAALVGQKCVVGWPTLLECRLMAVRQAIAETEFYDLFLARAKTEKVAFDGQLYELATAAFLRFGKGRHAAQLNFGDCMTYAVARSRDVPLLFKGGDFNHTDIAVHPASVILDSADI